MKGKERKGKKILNHEVWIKSIRDTERDLKPRFGEGELCFSLTVIPVSQPLNRLRRANIGIVSIMIQLSRRL